MNANGREVPNTGIFIKKLLESIWLGIRAHSRSFAVGLEKQIFRTSRQ
jgi:hypothetical protein